MKILLLFLFACPLVASEVEFEIKNSFSGGVYGRSYKDLFNSVGMFKDLDDAIGNNGAAWHTSVIGIHDIDKLLKLISSLDKLHSTPDEGVVATNCINARVSFKDIFKANDVFYVECNTKTYTHLSAQIDLSNLYGYRLFEDYYGQAWLQDIDRLITITGPDKKPSSPDGIAWKDKLIDLGYPDYQAEMLAWLAERNHINFNKFSGSMLLDFLTNSLNGTGQSLEEGASPLSENKSGLVRKSFILQEAAMGYKLPVNSWLSFSGSIKYMQGHFVSSFVELTALEANSGFNAIIDDIDDSFSFNNHLIKNVSADFSVLFAPVKNMVIEVGGRDLTNPRFKYKNFVAYLDPQCFVNFSYVCANVFESFISLDITRARDVILPNYHHQQFVTGIGLVPKWNNVNLDIKLTLSKNMAESQEPWLYGMQFGMKIYAFSFNFGGNSSIQTATLSGLTLPERFNFFASLSLTFKWR